MNKKKNIDFPFPNKKFIHSSELLNLNISYYGINKFVEKGILSKINGNTFENTKYEGDESDYLYVSGYINQGVVCLMSAAIYHEMSMVRSRQIDVAVKQKARVGNLPEWPMIGVFYFDKNRFETGITTIEIEGGSFKVYNREKTVCDLLSYRNKYGLEDCLSVLKNYLNREDRNINKLIEYSKKLRCYNVLSKYLEVLL